MKLKEDNEKMRAIWTIRLYEVGFNGQLAYDELGNIENTLIDEVVKENLIVTNGKNLMLDRLFGLSSSVAIGFVGIGTDSTAAAVGQTQLNPSVIGSVLIQAADSGTARSGQTVTISSTFGTGVGNFNIVEAGLFNGTTNGTSTMFNRLTFGQISKTSSMVLVMTIQITQS